MNTVKTLDNQRLIDIAMQELGDVSRVLELCQLNDMGLTDDMPAGTEIKVPDYDLSNRRIVSLFSDRSLAPASADDGIVTKPGGIGYMQIGNDFLVS